MARKSSFTPALQEEIKKQIWNGVKGVDLCSTFGLTAGSISAIKAGKMWPNVPWPGGATGPIPEELREAHVQMPTIDLDRDLRLGILHIPGAYDKMLAVAKERGFDSVHALHIANRDIILREKQKDMRAGLRRDGRKTPAPPPLDTINADKADKLPWDDIASRYDDLPMVQKAEDERMKDAISIIFFANRSDSWRRGEQAERAAKDISRRLRSERYSQAPAEGEVTKPLAERGNHTHDGGGSV